MAGPFGAMTPRTAAATARLLHIDQIVDIDRRARAAARNACAAGDSWVHLRRLPVLRSRRLLRFIEEPPCNGALLGEPHPIVRSLEPGEDWRWCYIDETVV